MKKFRRFLSFVLVIFTLNAISPECIYTCASALYDEVTGTVKDYDTGSVTVKSGAGFNRAEGIQVRGLVKNQKRQCCV